MTCRELTEFLDDYLAGNLPKRLQFSFRLHLALCRTCRVYLNTYRSAIHLAQVGLSDPEAEVPDSVPEPLVRAVLAARERTRRPTR